MLELVGVSHQIMRKKQEPLAILNQVSFSAPSGHLMAILGPTLGGKTALIRVLSGQIRPTHGAIVWHGKDIARNPVHPNEVGLVPAADDVLNNLLTVQENIVSAMLLRVAGLAKRDAVDRAAHIMVVTGVEMVSSQRAGTLTIPQRRRLKLAVALVTNPSMVLCDEFTDDLDAKSERELAALLQVVAADNPKRLVINATQNLSNLAAYNTVVLLNEGNVCFHGPARALPHYFSVKQMEEIYSRMAKRPANRWGESWDKHRDTYYNAFKLGADTEALAAASDEDDAAPSSTSRATSGSTMAEVGPAAVEANGTPPLPSTISQTRHLLQRRWTEFRRGKSDWLAHALMLFGFPLVASLFMWRWRELFSTGGGGAEATAYAASMAIFLQVLLVVLMSVRNGAQEIAAGRAAFERERTGGLRASAFMLAKLLYLAPLAVAQGAWMALFVDMMTGGLPGHALVRLGLLVATGTVFTILCLAISANVCSKDRASVWALRLVVAQVLLSGALFALPGSLGSFVHPVITAYAGWSGSLDTIHSADVLAAFDRLNGTWLAKPAAAFGILAAQAIAGLALLVVGVTRRRV